ncbi:MAG: EAL domain-containing protein [Cyanobacteriota bacterium]|nr:EAL domain-containing protein [Cyanobacteriota bacterium]
MNALPTAVIPATLLIVDDTPANLEILSQALLDVGYTPLVAIDGESAIQQAEYAQPDLILLDVMMPPGIDGFVTCQQLKANPRTQQIPVIFMTALNDTAEKVRGFNLGAVDYITKPFELEEVLARVSTHLQLRFVKQQLQTLNTELEERVQQRTMQLEEANRSLQREIAERQEVQKQLLKMALEDSLTGMPNRAKVMEALTENLKKAERDPSYGFAVHFIDCDRFKLVNDSLGHFVGDQLLIAIAQSLRAAIPVNSLLGRLGGDEFLVIQEGVQTVEDAVACAETIQGSLTKAFQLEPYQVYINVSIGIVLGSGYQQAEHLLRDADTAMYQAKSTGKGHYRLFEAAMHERAQTRLTLENDLRRAVEQQEFILHYQPIVELQSGRIVSLEALIRWHHPQKGRIPPDQFIGIAEETGLILPIGRWVLQTACQQLRQWHDRYPQQQHLTMSVNLSVKQFAQPHLIQLIDRCLEESHLGGSQIKLEITESAIMENAEETFHLLAQLRERQIDLSIDDFGTGYSSLSYLHRFPVSILKIDRTFVSRLDHSVNQPLSQMGIVRAIIMLSQSLHIQLVAEGIETPWQREQLLMMGSTYGQGYYFSRPLPAEGVEALLSNGMVLPLPA